METPLSDISDGAFPHFVIVIGPPDRAVPTGLAVKTAETLLFGGSKRIILKTPYGNGKFGPNDEITREQLATMLYRYAMYKGYDVSAGEETNILSYDDAFEISEWARPALQWAIGEGLVKGRTESTIVPQGKANRAETAVVFMRFIEG